MSNPQDVSALQRQLARSQGAQAAGPRPAPLTITLVDDDWAYDYQPRPTGAVVLGLRIPSGTDLERAHAVGQEAIGRIGELGRANATRNHAVARSVCDPNNFTKPHPVFLMPDDEVPAALTEATLVRIAEAVEQLMIDTLPLHQEASDVEIAQLVELLATDDPFGDAAPGRAAHARRYLRLALLDLTE